MNENPFPDTVIADWNFLDESKSRSQCPKCQKSRKYYCYTCYVPVPHLEGLLPRVKLPVKVDIIKHPSELDGKSTSPHAAILAPEDVTVHTYPCIPDFDEDKVVLVFPCEESVTIEELAVKFPLKESFTSHADSNSSDSSQAETGKTDADSNTQQTEHHAVGKGEEDSQQEEQAQNTCEAESQSDHQSENCRKRTHATRDGENCNQNSDESPSKLKKRAFTLPFEKVVFIDSTWNQTRNIVNDERLKNLTRVELQSQDTHFWRCQEGIPKSYLSTIEAIYYFMKDVHVKFLCREYDHEYDNLLFFFCYMYNKIRQSSDGGKGIKAYQR